LFADIISGAALEGTARTFRVGIDEEVGAEFCASATAEQVAALAELNAAIGAGEYDEVINGIVADAYGF